MFVFRAAAMTLRTVLLSLQALLSAAEPDDPQDAVVARQFKENNEMFQLTAKHWTNVYAGGKNRHMNFLYFFMSIHFLKKIDFKNSIIDVTGHIFAIFCILLEKKNVIYC